MKEQNVTILYQTSNSWRNKTAATDSAKFDPSMGDGGYKTDPGFPGAVFIAW